MVEEARGRQHALEDLLIVFEHFIHRLPNAEVQLHQLVSLLSYLQRLADPVFDGHWLAFATG